MKTRRHNRLKQALLLGVIVCALLPPLSAGAEPQGTFAGSWTASGQWQPVDFGQEREVFTYRISGHVNLVSGVGTVRDFWSDCIGLWDSETGGPARCVWKETGSRDAAFVVLDGQIAKEGTRVDGRFVGGTGSLEGLAGEVSFTWSSVFRSRTERVFTGHTRDLEGTYSIKKPAQ